MFYTLVEKAERGGAAVAALGMALFLRHARPLGILVILLCTATAALTAIYFPLITWDVVAYVATAMERVVKDPVLLHAKAWETIREAVPPGDFLVLTEDRPYRVVQYAEPAAFHSMLGFYRVKWLYVEVLARAGHFISPLSAIHLISAFSAAGIGLAILVWLHMADRLEWAPVAVATLSIAGYGEVARIGTPDGFAAFFFLVAVVAYLRGSEALTAVALFAAFLARPDHLAFIGVFMVVTVFLRQMSLGAIAAFVAAAAVYLPITSSAGHPGWWVQFWFTNVEYVPTIEGFDPDFSVVVYLKALVQAAVRSFIEASWVGLLIICLFGWAAMALKGFGPAGRERVILFALLLTIAAKFVLVPLHENRFQFAYVVAMAMVLVTTLPKLRLQSGQVAAVSRGSAP